MNSKPQIIEHNGKPTFVVLPIEEWNRIQEDLEDLEDVRLFDQAKAEGGETYPASVIHAILDGANPVKVFREWRGLTQAQLAEAASIAPLYLSQIETGRRIGSPQVLRSLANSLSVDIDLLVGSAGPEQQNQRFERRVMDCPPHVREMFERLDKFLNDLGDIKPKIDKKAEGKSYYRGATLLCRLDPKPRDSRIGVNAPSLDKRTIETIAKLRPTRKGKKDNWFYLDDPAQVDPLCDALRTAYNDAR